MWISGGVYPQRFPHKKPGCPLAKKASHKRPSGLKQAQQKQKALNKQQLTLQKAQISQENTETHICTTPKSSTSGLFN